MTPEYKTVPILDAARRAGVRIADGQAGRYEVKAFCPFCLGRTKNPHLYLNTEKNRFFCQRCGEHGNSVSLYAKIRGISNKEAFEELEKSNLQMFPQAAPKEPRQEYMAPLEQRHDVYYDLLALLSLSEHDFLDLLGRGLTLDSIEQNMYRSMPARVEPRSELAQTLSRTHDLHGVPGFYRSENGDWRLSGNSGLLIPYCTAKGYIQGLQRRAEIGGKRCYVWVSSNPDKYRKDGSPLYPCGTRAHGWIHITGNVHSTTASITEGALKGDTASCLSNGALYLCAPGVNAIKYLPSAIRSLSVERLLGEYDMDQIRQEQYSAALRRMQDTLKPLGIPYIQQMWNPAYNGIDDYKLQSRRLSLAA